MEMTALDIIPPEILKAYYPRGIAHQKLIEGGEINVTLLITDPDDRQTILQRLSRIYDESLAQDYEMIATHLSNQGWEMAIPHTTLDGPVCVRDNAGALWRSFAYIESQPGSEKQGDWVASIALAALLGKLHCSLAELDYQPRFVLDHANDIPRHVHRLQEVLPQLKDAAQRELATSLIRASNEPSIDAATSQLIHGDPRVGNVLFRNDRPFTFIDWDGVKIASPLVDVGDMLQSTLNELTPEALADFSIAQLDPVLHAYYEAARPTSSEEAFRQKALAAGRLIALDLGMRQLIDTVEDHFFTPPNQFESRYDFNLRRANEQWKVYQALRS